MTASVTVINTGDGASRRRGLAANIAGGTPDDSGAATAATELRVNYVNATATNLNAIFKSDSSSNNSKNIRAAASSSSASTKRNNDANNNNNNKMITSQTANSSNFSLRHTSLAYVAAASGAGASSPHKNLSYSAYDEAAEQDTVNRSLPLLTSAATAAATATSAVGGGGGNASNSESFNVTSLGGGDDDWSHFYDLMLSWQGICLIAVFCTFIVITIIGNTLVILAVITTRRLKTVTNCFVMSLAVADLLVGIFVMPPAVAVHLIGSWQLGWVLCDIWISLDVLLCTASILSLCAISVDRYLAVTQPLTYSRKRRSKRLALIMILIVWVLALAITCPPMLGWYEPGRRDLSECRYNQNEGYVIFSAMGSFFIPMAVMIYVYARISCVIASRHDHMTDISVHNKKFKRYTSADIENDADHDLSEQELSSGQKQKQAAARTFSNQTLAKDLILSDGDNGGGGGGSGSGSGGPHCHSLLTLTPASTKNGCYELTRPASLRRTPTASSTMTTMTSACGAGGGSGSALEQQQQHQHWSYGGAGGGQQQQQPPALQLQLTRPHSARHQQHLSVGGGTGGGILVASPNMAESSSGLRAPRVHHHHHHHGKSFTNRVTSMKKENKTTQTLSIVVGGFIACWLPFFIYYLITPFLAEHQVSRTLANVLTWLGWFNSAINPFIYAFYSVDFRAAFWRLTCKRFFSGSMKPQFPTNTMSIRR